MAIYYAVLEGTRRRSEPIFRYRWRPALGCPCP